MNFVLHNSIVKFISLFYNDIAKFLTSEFMDVKIEAVSMLVNNTYSVYEKNMNVQTKRKLYKEIISEILIQYLKSLLSSGFRKISSKEDLINKLRKDQVLFKNISCNQYVEDDHLRVISDILEFLSMEKEGIPDWSAKMREVHGQSFNLNILKAFLHLRIDISKNDRQSVISLCNRSFSVVDGLGSKENDLKNRLLVNNNLFDYINSSQILSVIEDLSDKSRIITNYERRKTMDISDYINLNSEKLTDVEENQDNYSSILTDASFTSEVSNYQSNDDSNILFSGYMKKKSSANK